MDQVNHLDIRRYLSFLPFLWLLPPIIPLTLSFYMIDLLSHIISVHFMMGLQQG